MLRTWVINKIHHKKKKDITPGTTINNHPLQHDDHEPVHVLIENDDLKKQNPATPIELKDKNHIHVVETVHPVEIRKREFLKKLALAHHSTGSPVHRTEYNLAHASKGLGVEGMFAVLPTLLMISFADESKDPAKSQTHLLRADQGLHSEKLYLVDELAERVSKQEIGLDEAEKELDAILNQPPRYPHWVQILCFGFSSACIAPFFFGGGWSEFFISFLLGMVVGLIGLLTSKNIIIARLYLPGSALIVSALARLLANYWFTDVCIFTVALASVVWLLPGLSLTTAITELATGNIISGTCRMFYAALVALQLGFGIAIGSGIIFWAKSSSSSEPCSPSIPVWVNVFFFFGASIPFNILMNAKPSQWPPMTFAQGFGYLISFFGDKALNPNAVSVIAAFGVGIVGGLYSRYSHHAPVVTTLAGILLLVPGSFGVRGVNAMFSSDLMDGLNFGFVMLVTSLCITVGLFVANLVVFPKKALHPDNLLF